MDTKVQVLDHGYVEFIEDWGRGKAGVPEAGIVEAARQSTRGGFRQWKPYRLCEKCGSWEAGGVVVYDGDLPTAAKCCYGVLEVDAHEWKEYPRGDLGLLSFLYNNRPQHATPFEFCGMVIEVQAPIFVFREWHRHRVQSFNEMSARYAPLPDLNYVPTVERLMANTGGKNKQAGTAAGAVALTEAAAERFRAGLEDAYQQQERLYQYALRAGVPKELARVSLPVGRYSRMRAAANLRNWLAFMTLRADPAAQWEIQQFAAQVGHIIAARFPHTWSLFVEAKQRGK